MKLSAYDLTIGETIYALIPEQYRDTVMYIDGVETKIKSSISASWIQGTFQGMPKATSGFYFKTIKPIDGGLYLIDINTRSK
jgi:hypothetical protein